MKKLICALLSAAMVLSLTACGPKTAPDGSADAQSQTEASTVVFTDDLGREVTLEAEPEKAAVLIGSFADVWCLAGGKDSLAAAAHDSWTQFDLGLGEEVADLGAIKEPNVELLLASEPDFVLGSTKTAANVELVDMLDKAGIPCAMFNVSSFEDYLRLLEICTRLTGREENYQTYGLDIRAQIDNAKKTVTGDSPEVLYVRATGSSCKVKNSEDTVLGEMLADLGCTNIADSETGLLENLSMETILVSDPEHIFIVLQGSDPSRAQATLESTLLSNPAWNSLTAVKEGRVHFMDQKLYSLKPNAKWGEAYEDLAEILYPEAK